LARAVLTAKRIDKVIEAQIKAFAYPHMTDNAAHFHVSGIPETWRFGLIGFETMTSNRFAFPFLSGRAIIGNQTNKET
jgi:hypothetical protein